VVRGGYLSRDKHRVLLLSLVFPPDAVSTAQLFGELVEDLTKLGWTVMVVTTKPHYHRAEPHNESLQAVANIWGGLVTQNQFGHASVFHTAIPMKGSSVAMRIAGWLCFHFLSLVVALTKIGRVDVILAPSPPLSIGVIAWLIGVFKRAPFIYNVQELYPDTAARLGALHEGAVLNWLHRMERFVYRRAFAVTTIAPGMARTIAERTTPAKVRVIPNFVDTAQIALRPRDNAFSREFDLNGRFTVVYAGNMGPAQQLETVIETAEITAGSKSILYVFVGDGTARSALESLASSKGLSNVVFIPQQRYDRVPDIYGASDLCVVPLAANLAVEAVPSKVYRIMSAERRILAIADDHSDLAALVRESGGGIVVHPGNPRRLAAAILEEVQVHDDKPVTGRGYVMRYADRKYVTRLYSDLLEEAIRARGNGRSE
jgi:colanic acid biosynthesis glycosyl transferase WcaI